jgi:Fic family protein
MGEAVDLLEQLPLCMRVLNAAHAVLMDGVRGQGKSPGTFRKIPNWIGPPGCSVDEARFVPISPEKLPDAMKGWETYVHAQTPDRLVQLALLHAEFEALHPFLDGNGRLGRMFVPLFLFSIGLLQSPMFYISAYLEARRDEYYEHLLAVSRDNDWTGWCVFFLTALIEQAKENHAKARAIVDLYQTEKERIVELSRSHYAIRALDFFFHRPIFSTSSFIETTGIPKTTANRMLAAFQKGGLLSVFRSAEGRKPAVLAFNALLEIAEGANIS